MEKEAFLFQVCGLMHERERESTFIVDVVRIHLDQRALYMVNCVSNRLYKEFEWFKE